MSEALVFETCIQPRNHAVLIKPLRPSELYKGVLHLPDQNREASNSGIIVRTGNAVRSVHIGEWVLYNWRQAITVDGDFIVLDERALIAVLAEPREVLIPIGVISCSRPACSCMVLIRALNASGACSAEVVPHATAPLRYIRKFEAIVQVHVDRYILGYADAYGIRTYDVVGMDDKTLVKTIISDLRPSEEESNA